MLSINSTENWHAVHPGAIIGLLELSSVANASPSFRLNEAKRETEGLLRERYSGFTRTEFLALPVISAYQRYYKRFEKTYHVLLQLETVVVKGKNLPDVSPLVDANYTAEVETLVLTAGHDVAKLKGAVSIDVSREGDRMTQMSGVERPIRAGDMIMRDAGGICCSIIYGQDSRSPISAGTTGALYVSYAPPGVTAEAVEFQLLKIEECVRLFSPALVVEQRCLISA
jgi:DNA/RNA-binding domain of Phe-tRNA-synthetase-like protein